METSSSSSTEPSATGLLNPAIQRLSGQSAACKLCGAALGTVVLLFAAGRSGGESLLWAAAPVGLLGLVDAGYVATVRRLAQTASGQGARVGEVIGLQGGTGGFQEVRNLVTGVLSLSVWPFYLALGGLIAGLGISGQAMKPQAGPGASYTQPVPFAGNVSRPAGGMPAVMAQPPVSQGYPGTPPNGYPPAAAPSQGGIAPSPSFTTSRFPNASVSAPGNRPFPNGATSPRATAGAPSNNSLMPRPAPAAKSTATPPPRAPAPKQAASMGPVVSPVNSGTNGGPTPPPPQTSAGAATK